MVHDVIFATLKLFIDKTPVFKSSILQVSVTKACVNLLKAE